MSNYPSPPQAPSAYGNTRVLVVDPHGSGHYKSLKEACDWLETLPLSAATGDRIRGPSSRWQVQCVPGKLVEDPFTFRPT